MNYRIHLLGLTGMTRELFVRLVDEQPDMEIVEALDEPVQPAVASVQQVDVFIVGLHDDQAPEAGVQVLADQPRSLIGISQDGRRAFRYYLRLGEEAIGETSPSLMFDVIRRSAGAWEAGGPGPAQRWESAGSAS
jgi:hypothetical protein